MPYKEMGISVDESTDAIGRYVANIIGKLDNEKYHNPYLLMFLPLR